MAYVKCDIAITFNVNFYFCKHFRIWKITHISSLQKIYSNMTLNKKNNKNTKYFEYFEILFNSIFIIIQFLLLHKFFKKIIQF